MNALIISSVHALCDVASFERDACNRACAHHGIPAVLTERDHAHVLGHTTMLGVLAHLPGSLRMRRALVSTYLDLLNDAIWGASTPAYKSILAMLRDPQGYRRPTGFVSDYPTLTTNLLRSSALRTNATKLGQVTAVPDGLDALGVTVGLTRCAAALNVTHDRVEVIVAHQRDFNAARALGMHARFVDERQTHRIGHRPSRRSVENLGYVSAA